jgi:hypothetical protein
MKSRSVVCALCVLSVLVLLSATGAVAQVRGPAYFTGVLNDYSPANAMISGSPYEMHGQWSIDLHPWSNTADFQADMTMSDYGTTNGVLDATKGGQNAHTHHIRLTNIKVIWDMIGCPPYPKPVPTGGFQFTGTVSLITGNGGTPTFETTPPSSVLQVCVTGGSEVPYANMTMVFTGPATNHFGTQPIHGVVRKVEPIGLPQ